MKKLQLAEDLTLPVDAATQTFLVVGKRGSGKSNTAARNVEQLLSAKIPVVVLDPVDSWYGLKASRDGKGEGFGVYVFGGRHKDVELEPGAGVLVAEFLCEHRAPLVLSCKHLSGLERSRFMVDFAMTLFRKWTGGVLHIVLEEAHELAPQNPPKGEKAEQMLGAFKKLWKLGRSSGIGGTAVTQRPASLHKDITTQSEILVVHRTIGPQDVEAVRQWIKYHRQGEEILPELATLKTGEAFVWAPEFPEEKPIGLRRVQILQRETFDSAATPKAGEQRVEPKELASVDLDRLRSKMASTIERQKAEDPRELRKTIVDLRAQLAAAAGAKPAAAGKQPRTVERLILREAQVERLLKVIEQLHDAYGDMVDDLADRVGGPVQKIANEMKAALAAARDALNGPARVRATVGNAAPAAFAGGGGRAGSTLSAPGSSRPSPVVSRVVAGAGDREVGTGGLRRILVALAQRPQGLSASQVGVRATLSSKSGTFDTYISRARKAGWITGERHNLRITEAGLAALGSYDPLPTGAALLDHWLRELGTSGAARILQALANAYPRELTRSEVADAANLTGNSGTFDTYVSRLRSLELISGRGALKASDELFD